MREQLKNKEHCYSILVSGYQSIRVSGYQGIRVSGYDLRNTRHPLYLSIRVSEYQGMTKDIKDIPSIIP